MVGATRIEDREISVQLRPNEDHAFISLPPFTDKHWPVMNDAALDKRKHTGGATSSGVLHRPSGMRARYVSRNFSPRIVSVIGVSTSPNDAVFTRTPYRAHSRAALMVAPSTPALAAL